MFLANGVLFSVLVASLLELSTIVHLSIVGFSNVYSHSALNQLLVLLLGLYSSVDSATDITVLL